MRESLGISPEGTPPNAPGVMPEPTEEADQEPVAEAAPVAIPKQKEVEPQRKTPAEVAVTESPETTGGDNDRDGDEEPKPVVLETEGSPVGNTPAKPVRSLRKSERLSVDRPKPKVARDSGKLPTHRQSDAERVPLAKPTPEVTEHRIALPERRHTDQELARLRHAPAPAPAEPPRSVRKAAWPALVAIYAGGILLMILSIAGNIMGKMPRFDLPFDWMRAATALPSFRMILYGLLAGGVAVMCSVPGGCFFGDPSRGITPQS